jgi:hypothetical protein
MVVSFLSRLSVPAGHHVIAFRRLDREPVKAVSPERGWSEAESLYRIAASRTLAVVMAGIVPFVSLRSGDPWAATGEGTRDSCKAVTQPKPHVRKRPPEEWNRFSGGR